MRTLNLPFYQIKTRENNRKIEIWDEFRRNFFVLTPEEHVRQQFAQYLVQEKNWPKGRIALEYSLKINNLQKRADLVVFSKKMEVEIIVECKAPSIKITQHTFDQIARYNMKFNAKFLLVTNGLAHFCCAPNYKTGEYTFFKDIPEFAE